MHRDRYAMQETEYMWGRDDSKDPKGDAMNVWCLNLNLDMLKQVGYTGNGHDLITPDSLPKVTSKCPKHCVTYTTVVYLASRESRDRSGFVAVVDDVYWRTFPLAIQQAARI